MHLEGLVSFLRLICNELPQKHQGKRSPYYEYAIHWTVYGILAINSWFWSVIFHSRDVVLTERMDYCSAILVIGYSLIIAFLRTFHIKSEMAQVILVAPIILFLIIHMLYLNLFNFDYANIMICDQANGASFVTS
ncbi:hypothetical protein KP509_1Z327900 [Ceratopteris richardii]|nr:hypothetical protein KP509_1Z327900 [Ceratopteris richardii]